MDARLHIQNQAVVDGTVGVLIQVGVLNGEFVVQAPAPVEPLEKAADVLAQSVFAQWREEANTWDLADPAPLKVSWAQRWDVADHPEKVGAGGSGRIDGVETVAGAFLAGEQRRLVILGVAGAGKTTLAVLLALELLTRRLKDGERHGVPLVLPLSDWDAERHHFRTWLTQRVTADYPGLPAVEGRHPAARLVSDRRLIPILEGLDELPPHRRRAVLSSLNHALAPGDPVVLTSRSAEYEALSSSGYLVGSAAVVEALPVAAEVGVEYLRLATPPGLAHRWEPVFAELRRHPAGPLAEALSTPLMVWLARRTYRNPPADPGELLDTRRLPDRAAIEDHLLDQIVPTVFAPTPPGPDRMHAPGQWNPERAHRWLAFLAGYLTRRQTVELAWWRLHTAALPRVLGLPVLVVLGIGLGAIVNTVIGWHASTASRSGELFLDTLGPVNALFGGIVFGRAVQMATLLWFGHRLWQPRRRANPFRLGAALRSAGRGVSLRRALGAGTVVVVPSVLLSLWVLGDSMRDVFVLVVILGYAAPAVLMVVFAAPSDAVDAPSPDALLRAERRSVGLTVGIVAPLIGLGQAAPDWVSGIGHRGWPEVLTGWFGAAAILALLSPWSRWQLSRCTLALAGCLPWSLPEFLRDAHRNGLLRRSGGSYRFRNLRLQQRLAATRGRPVVPHQRPAPSSRHGSMESPGPTAAPVGRPQAGTMVPSLSANRNFRVHETPGDFRAQGRARRFVIAHWRALPMFIGGWVLLNTLTGRWTDPVAWTWVFVLVGVWILITLVSYLLPGKWVGLRITADFVESTMGRKQSHHRWDDVEQIAIRRIFRRGVDSGYYGLHVRLHPGAPPPSSYFAGADGWWLVLPMAVNQAVPPDVAAALARYAGRRWQPPIPPG
ncbi:NACHT domain-containing protein [Micromonospora sp. WMMD956]|uniref:NACHT domain-containing protein n=1 Tax=Micromonospora sp. WMMD956 TaxID=3016108 RepID=UPI002415DE51|nr:NACHT domain-containing protein [Micromonospora sp. WMMD956]MDG4814830.1 NACHT domain-containing protein [Micromonospora sp. WMMD956]